jgi:hypothetical protein
MDESCDVGVIGDTRDLEGPEMDSAVHEEYLLVPCFEGEEDDQCKTTDLPVAECSPSPIEFTVVEVFDRAPKSMSEYVAEVPPMYLNPLVGLAMFFKGLESHYDTGAVCTSFLGHFEPF